MKKEEGVKAIVFDVGGVLALGVFSTTPKRGHHMLGVHEYISKKLKMSLDQWLDAIDTNYALSIEGKISEEKTLDIISKNTKTSKKKLKKIIVLSYKKNFKQNKPLYDFAFKLKKQGYKIGILSDQWPFSKEALILKKYTKKFDSVIVSCDVGMRKPNPKIYKFLLKKLKLPAKQVLFIDNQEWNIKPADKIGMKTILFKNNSQLFNQLEKFGVNYKDEVY